jgi:broad specificity phosphatase PhoE
MIPESITLVRHGQSRGNVDMGLFQTLPDERMDLTPEGEKQAEAAIPVIRSVIGNERALFYASPYLRCKRTAAIIRAGFPKEQTSLIEDNHLRERKLGNLISEKEFRNVYAQFRAQGFFYHPPCGESTAEVFTRTEIFRNAMKARWNWEAHPKHIVIVGHNTALKTFLMAELSISASHFEELGSMGNAQAITLRPRTTDFGVQFYPDELPICITQEHINSTMS